MVNAGKRYKIVYNKSRCIGAYACLAAEPSTWRQGNAKAELIGGAHSETKKDEILIKEVDDLENNVEAAEVCPVKCIHIYENSTGKKII